MDQVAPSHHPAASVFRSMAAALQGVDKQSERDALLRKEETQKHLRYVHWFEARWMAEAFIIDRLSVEECAAKFNRPRDTIWDHIKRVTNMVPRNARVHYSLHGWDFPDPLPTTRKPGRKPRPSAITENRN